MSVELAKALCLLNADTYCRCQITLWCGREVSQTGALLPKKLNAERATASFYHEVFHLKAFYWRHTLNNKFFSKTDLELLKFVSLYKNLMIKLYIKAELKPKNIIQPELNFVYS